MVWRRSFCGDQGKKYDPEIIKAGLEGAAINRCKAMEEVEEFIERLEVVNFRKEVL